MRRKLFIGIRILFLTFAVGSLLWIGLRPPHEPNVPHVSKTPISPPSLLQPKIVPPDPAGLFLPADIPLELKSNEPAVRRSRVATLNRALLEQNDLLSLNLFPDVCVSVQLERHSGRSRGSVVYSGTLLEPHRGSFMLVDHNGAVAGVAWIVGGRTYDIRSIRGNELLVREIDANNVPHCGGAPVAVRSKGSSGTPSLAPIWRQSEEDPEQQPTPVIDVLVAYTEEAVTAVGSEENMLALLELAEEQTNNAYRNSKVQQHVRFVRTIRVNYEESRDGHVDLARLEDPSDGYLDWIHDERDRGGADLVCMIVSEIAGAAGVANILSPDENGDFAYFEQYAFSVVAVDYAVTNLSLAHELGHNMGCRHDRLNAGDEGAFPFSYGYRDHRGIPEWHTIMAYPPGIRIPYFSNPEVRYYGQPTGKHDRADNAKTINLTAASVAAFRPTKVLLADAGPDQLLTGHLPDGSRFVTLDGSNSRGQYPITSYVWLENGNQIASGPTVRLPLSQDVHEISLTVTDVKGNQADDNTTISIVDGQDPIAKAGPDQTVLDHDNTGSAFVTLDGSHSQDPDGLLLFYEWSEYDPEDPEKKVILATTRTAVVSLSVGVHTITLTVTDRTGRLDTDDMVVTVGKSILRVGKDEEYTDIQSAINDAQPGAIVLVSKGTYTGPGNRDIDFLGKAITVTSVVGPHDTIIDCEGTYRGFLFTKGEGRQSVLSGFTIQRGYASNDVWPYTSGGAIYCSGTSPLLHNLILSDNYSKGPGGAISCVDSTPYVYECAIERNTCEGGPGGGINSYLGGLILVRSRIIDNHCLDSYGGGVAVHDGYIQFQTFTCIDTLFADNESADDGGGLFTSAQYEVVIDRCRFMGNSTTGHGGGIYISGHHKNGTNGKWIIRGSLMAGNGSETGRGGGVYLRYGDMPVMMQGCVLTGNNAVDGGALGVRDALMDVSNCTVVHNQATGSGDAAYVRKREIAVRGSIIWGNDSFWGNGSAPIFITEEGKVKISYSDVQGGGSGQQVLDVDPKFVDPERGDYRLQRNSPCIDSGWGARGGIYYDAPWVANTGADPLPYANTATVPYADMGAYEWVPEGSLLPPHR